MTADRFLFYAKHYSDIGRLLALHEEVQSRYTDELWKMLQKNFTDRFSAGKFAGLTGWQCEEEADGPNDYLSIWHPSHHDDHSRGPYFSIDISESADFVPSPNKQKLRSLATCYLMIDKSGGPLGISTKSLVSTAQKQAKRLQKAKFEPVGDPKDCFVQVSLGDLLHVSAYESRQEHFNEMMARVERLVKACIPVIDAAS